MPNLISDETAPPPPKTKRANIFAERAGFTVMLMSGLAIMLAFGTLCYHIWLIESKIPTGIYANLGMMDCPDATDCKPQETLESAGQFLRSERVFTMLSTRMSLFVFGEIVAMIMCVAGGVLILNRIESANDREGTLTWYELSLRTTFPGILMCALGTAIVVSTMWFATRPNSQVTVLDYPIYIKDQNTTRNLAGVASGMVPGATPTAVQDSEASGEQDVIDNLEVSANQQTAEVQK